MARNMNLNPNGRVATRDLQTFSARLTNWNEEQTDHKLSERVVSALLFEDKEEREFRICEAHQETFRWVFEQGRGTHSKSWSDIGAWLEGDQDIYWITGKPGSGKSTFVKFLSREPRALYHLKQWGGRMPLVIARFYFWNSGSVSQMSQMGLLRSLLHDILRKMPHLVSKAFPQRWRISKLLGQDTRAWTLSELTKAFKTVLKCCESSFKLCMFVDGLDEFSGSHDKLVELFKEVVSYPNVKACLSSRPWVVFEDAFSQKANLQLHDLTYPDVRRFTHASFHSNRQFLRIQARDPDRSAALIDAITTRAAGVFLWVDLAVRSLLSGLSNHDRMSDLQRRINDIPPDLETFYEKMFESIEDFYFEHACQLLQIVGEAKGRLTVVELSFADEEDFDAQLSMPTAPLSPEEKQERYEATKRRLNSRCKGFLEIPTWITEDGVPETHEQLDTVMEDRVPDMRLQVDTSLANSQSSTGTVNTQTADVLPWSPADVKVSYLHRTARDFLHTPKMKQQIQMGAKKSFCPFFPLFHSSILSLNTFQGPVNHYNQPKLWEHIENSLEYAAECESWSGMPQTRLLQKLDEIVTVVSMNEVPDSREEQNSRSSLNDSTHWTATSRDSNDSSSFVDLAAKYDMPLYILHTIKSGLKETGDSDPDIHRCLFHVVRDFQKNAGVCEWVGCRVPRLSFISFLLKRGADPNKYYNSVNAIEIVLSEAVEASQNDTITEKRRCLEHWALVIEEFINHNGNPKANRNSAVGSMIREAFGKLLPERARHLERLMKRSGRRWFTSRKYVVPPLVGSLLSTEVDPIPIPLFNRLQRAQDPRSYPVPCRDVDTLQTPWSPHNTIFYNDTPMYYHHHWEKPLAPHPQFRHPEELRTSNTIMRAPIPCYEAERAYQSYYATQSEPLNSHLPVPEPNSRDVLDLDISNATPTRDGLRDSERALAPARVNEDTNGMMTRPAQHSMDPQNPSMLSTPVEQNLHTQPSRSQLNGPTNTRNMHRESEMVTVSQADCDLDYQYSSGVLQSQTSDSEEIMDTSTDLPLLPISTNRPQPTMAAQQTTTTGPLVAFVGIQTHTNVQSVACEFLGCSSRFSRPDDLFRHRMGHHPRVIRKSIDLRQQLSDINRELAGLELIRAAESMDTHQRPSAQAQLSSSFICGPSQGSSSTLNQRLRRQRRVPRLRDEQEEGSDTE